VTDAGDGFTDDAPSGRTTLLAAQTAFCALVAQACPAYIPRVLECGTTFYGILSGLL